MPVNIAIINESSVCTDDEIDSYVPALQQQVGNDFAPVWGVDATLTFVPRDGHRDPAAWLLGVFDDSDQAGALGYHDLTAQDQPLGKVFAASDRRYGQSVSVTISHELLEMLGDPGINTTASGPDPSQPNNPNAPAFYAYEACDACESDSYSYLIDGVAVSDFVYPAWFGGVEAAQFDHGKQIGGPFQILEGGYIGVWTPANGWNQLTGAAAHGPEHRSRANVGSRRERRTVGRGRWARSTR
jgi:hypothetical protein